MIANSTTTGAALSAHGVRKRFRHTTALDAVDLSVPAGSVLALLGPNGAGKTTLIRTWLGFERPNAGRVEVEGLDPWRQRAAAVSRLGYVPQRPAVHPGLSVNDHIALVRGLRQDFDVAYARRRLTNLGIPLEQRADTLSGGQAAQLSLALALATHARVLLLDEPLASLDPLARREFLRILLDDVRGEGLTAVISTHIITDIEAPCDRLAILDNGTMLLDSSLEEARRMHRVSNLSVRLDGALAVGSFPGRDQASTLTLWRVEEAAGSRIAHDSGGTTIEAGLEDIVLGYLAARRSPAAENPPES